MDIVQYEEYLKEKNIHVIPSSYWESDYPNSFTLIKPFDPTVFQKIIIRLISTLSTPLILRFYSKRKNITTLATLWR